MKRFKSVMSVENEDARKQKKLYLVNKISDAIKMKYSNILSEAKVDDKELKKEIINLISIQYYAWHPKNVFKPIETDVLDIIKKKNPNLKIQIKKARKLPPIKTLLDKYQEADKKESETNRHKEENENKLTNIQLNLGIFKKSKSKILDNNRSKNTFKNKNNKKNKVKAISFSKSIDKKNVKYTFIKPIYQDIKPITQKKDEQPHELLDKINYKKLHDEGIQIVEEDRRLRLIEIEKKQKEKIDKQIMLRQYFKEEMEDKNKKKKEIQLLKLKEKEEIDNKIIIEKEEIKKELERKYENQKKNRDLMGKYLSEKNLKNREKKRKELAEDKKMLSLIKNEPTPDQKIYLARKAKILEEVKKEMEMRISLPNQKEDKIKKNFEHREESFQFGNNSLEIKLINDRVLKRQKSQDEAVTFLQKIKDFKEKENERLMVININNETGNEKLKKNECEEADKNRRAKIEMMKKSLNEIILSKVNKKNIEKMEKYKYHQEEENNYKQFLLEEKDKKRKKFEQYENYRKALEKQIKENKERDLHNNT